MIVGAIRGTNDSVSMMHPRETQILSSVKHIPQRIEHSVNSAVEQAFSSLVTPYRGANALVTPYWDAQDSVTSFQGANELVSPYQGAQKVASYCGTSQVAPCGTANCYIQRPDEREQLMMDPGAASMPPVQAVTAERKEIKKFDV